MVEAITAPVAILRVLAELAEPSAPRDVGNMRRIPANLCDVLIDFSEVCE